MSKSAETKYSPTMLEPRKGTPNSRLTKTEFRRRFLSRFQDRAFDGLRPELDKVASAAWDGYKHQRKAPHTRKAGTAFKDPDYELSVDWLAARDAIHAAQERHRDPDGPARILLISGSSRSEHTCPGEISKSYRLVRIAQETMDQTAGVKTTVLELHRLASEYGRMIHPCKACFSTSPALCHWPCSCLVCADGGNPDPTSTEGKDAKLAKPLELEGWRYPRHLAGRIFSVVVHGDVAGVENVRRSLSDWLCYMHLEPAGPLAEVDRYIGYWKPYALSHAELDADEAVQEEVRNAARTLVEAVTVKRAGKLVSAGAELSEPRQK
jgi:multimeric flavodoxin WrbA